jgi:2-amino-4-hydroxy-6-hydroxymethyldihydropteridine diphosphokinase
MNVVFLSLGGNLGNRSENLNRAIEHIKAIGAKIIKVSSLYETAAWGSTSTKKYLNQVIQIGTSLTAHQLLKETLSIEKRMGRVRTSDRNTDRVIDIDLLFFNNDVSNSKTLHIPHPRIQLRKFVLIPLNEIAAKFIHPVLNQPIKTLLKKCEDVLDVKLYKKESTFRLICIEGNIGSGKTTIAKALAKKLHADFLAEKFEDNDLLSKFYSNKKQDAFHLEYSLLLSRTQQLAQYLKAPAGVVICDFDLHKSLWFAKHNLATEDYKFFKKKALNLVEAFPKPELIVYLDTDLKNLKENIKKRNRVYEKNINSTYLEAIGEEYKKGLAKLKDVTKLLITIKKYSSKTEQVIVSQIAGKLGKIV